MRDVMRVLSLCLILGMALVGCGQAGGRGGADAPTPIPTAVVPLPVSSPPVFPVPTALPPWTPDPSGPPPTPGVVLTPNSARVQQGQSVPFVLYTHCGIDFDTDFDGSFWDAVHPQEWSTDIGNPFQQGTMTLIDTNHARFTWTGGSIDYTRHVGPKVVPGLCA